MSAASSRTFLQNQPLRSVSTIIDTLCRGSLATETDPRLAPGSVDMVLLVDAYHEFSHPREVMSRVAESLKPTGKVVLIEYRGEDPAVPIKELHKMTEAQVRRELSAAGLSWTETRGFLPQQHFMVFSRASAP
jgi:predicted methyltransferase